MKKILLLLAILLPFWSLSAHFNDRYGVNKDGFVTLVTKENKLMPLDGITHDFFEKVRNKPGYACYYDGKMRNYKITSFMFYSFDIVYDKALVSNLNKQVRKIDGERIFPSEKSCFSFFFLFLFIFTAFTIFLILKDKSDNWILCIILMAIAYLLMIVSYGFNYVFLSAFVLCFLIGILNYIFIKNNNIKQLQIVSATLIFIMPLVVYYML